MLDVGSGSGYLCAAFYEMMDKQGTVIGIEHIQSLVDQSLINLNLHQSIALKKGDIRIICADGRLGCPEFAPYNAINVGAAVEIVPNALLQQLSADGGRLVIPVGPVGE